MEKERSKAKAKELLELAKQTEGPWRAWLNESLLKLTRLELLQKLEPGVKAKKKSFRPVVKATMKQAGLLDFAKDPEEYKEEDFFPDHLFQKTSQD